MTLSAASAAGRRWRLPSLATLIDRLRHRRAEQNHLRALAAMDDALLQDIGLRRPDLQALDTGEPAWIDLLRAGVGPDGPAPTQVLRDRVAERLRGQA